MYLSILLMGTELSLISIITNNAAMHIFMYIFWCMTLHPSSSLVFKRCSSWCCYFIQCACLVFVFKGTQSAARKVCKFIFKEKKRLGQSSISVTKWNLSHHCSIYPPSNVLVSRSVPLPCFVRWAEESSEAMERVILISQ